MQVGISSATRARNRQNVRHVASSRWGQVGWAERPTWPLTPATAPRPPVCMPSLYTRNTSKPIIVRVRVCKNAHFHEWELRIVNCKLVPSASASAAAPSGCWVLWFAAVVSVWDCSEWEMSSVSGACNAGRSTCSSERRWNSKYVRRKKRRLQPAQHTLAARR